MYTISKKLILVVIISIVSLCANAQKDTGRISGVVKDVQNKKLLTEAVITVKSDAMEGQKFAITDSAGQYKINNLPPGAYTITFEMEGYQKFSQQNIVLKEATALKVSYEMVREGHKKRREEVVSRQ